MQRLRPPVEAALSFGRSSLGSEATGSKSSPSCKAECLDRASGGCRLRQAAGLVAMQVSGKRRRVRGSCSGCLLISLCDRRVQRCGPAPALGFTAWSLPQVPSGKVQPQPRVRKTGLGFFFFVLIFNFLFKAIKKRLWLSRQSSANCERSQRQRNAMALRAPCTQPCAGCRCRGPSDRLGAGAGRGGERRPRTPQSGTEVSAGSRGSRKAPTRRRTRAGRDGRAPSRSFSASSESRPAQRCRPGEPSPGSPARCPAEQRARLARTSRTPRSAAAPSAARGAPAARPHLTRREVGARRGERRPGLPRAGVSARLPRHIGGADPARAVPAAAPRCPAAVPE